LLTFGLQVLNHRGHVAFLFQAREGHLGARCVALGVSKEPGQSFGSRDRFGSLGFHCGSRCVRVGLLDHFLNPTGLSFFRGHVQNGRAHGDFNAVLAVGHASFVGVNRPLAVFGRRTVINDEAFSVRHFDVQEGLVRQNEIVINQVVRIQDIGDDRIDLVIRQALATCPISSAYRSIRNLR